MLNKCGVTCGVLFGATPRLKPALLAACGVFGVLFPLPRMREKCKHVAFFPCIA
jgi:hypothetical protein